MPPVMAMTDAAAVASDDLMSRLRRALPAGEGVAVAVSGGVDSMTLAHVAARVAALPVIAFHAVSPAVPPLATRRVREHAARWGWDLQMLDAGEFADPGYRANPVNRCYFCKTSLYRSLRSRWAGPLFSGTNTDDLRDFRPGLQAAADWRVAQPYVEAGIDKAGIRLLAGALGLRDLQDLPAQPCLASRIETGIPIEGDDLRMVDGIEALVRERLGDVPIRCRVRRRGITLELAPEHLAAAPVDMLSRLEREISGLCAGWQRPFAGIEAYRMGSAFLKDPA